MKNLEAGSISFAATTMFIGAFTFFLQHWHISIVAFFIAAISFLIAYLVKRARYLLLEDELKKAKLSEKMSSFALEDTI